MSETDNDLTAPTIPPVKRKTIEDAKARHVRETQEGIGIKIYDGEESPENYCGTVFCCNDPKGYQRAIARAKGKKPKSHTFSDLELFEIGQKAEVGTFFRGIADWIRADGSPIPNTEDGLAEVLGNDWVKTPCWQQIGVEENWLAEQTRSLQGNS